MIAQDYGIDVSHQGETRQQTKLYKPTIHYPTSKMILIHMPSKLSTTLPMKEGLTYVMVMLAYHRPFTEFNGCNELG
jgi:hypothetical protein